MQIIAVPDLALKCLRYVFVMFKVNAPEWIAKKLADIRIFLSLFPEIVYHGLPLPRESCRGAHFLLLVLGGGREQRYDWLD